MRILKVPAVKGLYNEFFDPDPTMLQEYPQIKNFTLRGEGAFWNSLFQSNRIEHLVKVLEDNLHSLQWQIPQYHSIIANPQEFLSRVLSAATEICSPSCDTRHFFSCLETLAILCKLYSDFEFFPIQLTLQDGFLLNDQSSDVIYQECLHPQKNPYLGFVDQTIMPLIKKAAPDILFIEGRLNHYLAAVAKRSKSLFPKLHICLTRHASEYYSLNKITALLKQNQELFQIVDSIVLEFFNETEELLVKALSQGKALCDVPNLLYKDASDVIQETCIEVPISQAKVDVYPRSYNSTADIHLEPFVKCHWNQCSFCGINKKYHYVDTLSSEKDFALKINQIKTLSDRYRYIWFIDEALRPSKMRLLATLLLENGVNVFWQARCRASVELIEDNLPELLYQAGLRELRIGLESASYSVLNLMHKFDQNFSLADMEKIIRAYTDVGISIHCPMILGFPQEEAGDRQKTYEFLTEMHEKYPLFSFNINILCLDISSSLYKYHAEYQMQGIRFPCTPKHFLGNWLAWMPPDRERALDAERQTFMREQLYPWMPYNSLTSPTLLYRLTETARRTLQWKTLCAHKKEPIFSYSMTLKTASSIAVTKESKNQYLVYCWESHHYMQGNGFLMQILNAFREPGNVTAVIKSLVAQNPNVFQYQELSGLIYKMFLHGYLTGNYSPCSGSGAEKVRAIYNDLYRTETYLYNLETERMLTDYQESLPPGEALELGIGMGRNIPFLLKRGFRVTGIDISDVAIQKLKETYGSQGVFVAEDIRQLTVQPLRYSLIVCSMVLSYLNNSELHTIAKTLQDSLKSGGYLFIKDLSNNDPLTKVPKDCVIEQRNFFTKEKILQLFPSLEPIEVSCVLRKEDHRIGCDGYFDLIYYLAKKSN